MRTTIDLSPFHRSVIGFDRLARALEANMADTSGYPPYNVERVAEDRYRVTLAVAGFTEADITATVQDGTLTVRGAVKQPPKDDGRVIYRGIGTRAFERRFQLADHLEVVGAALENGLLHIDLVRHVPEALKPRSIPIQRITAPTPTPVAEIEATAQAA